ncbi:unnamed protein product [Fusarium graminearum]|nr:unnamed protein product [Fusarium graminearum]
MTTGSISPNDLSARHAVQSIQTMSPCNHLLTDRGRSEKLYFIYDQDDEDPDFDPSMPNCDTDTKDPIADAHNIKVRNEVSEGFNRPDLEKQAAGDVGRRTRVPQGKVNRRPGHSSTYLGSTYHACYLRLQRCISTGEPPQWMTEWRLPIGSIPKVAISTYRNCLKPPRGMLAAGGIRDEIESIIYNGEADWAFTTQGIAYTAGQRHRSSNQVIQIRDVQASQFCIKDLATLDTTVSITGDKELEPTDRIEKLALVVGESLESVC